jgi:hypothetical protein
VKYCAEYVPFMFSAVTGVMAPTAVRPIHSSSAPPNMLAISPCSLIRIVINRKLRSLVCEVHTFYVTQPTRTKTMPVGACVLPTPHSCTGHACSFTRAIVFWLQQ